MSLSVTVCLPLQVSGQPSLGLGLTLPLPFLLATLENRLEQNQADGKRCPQHACVREVLSFPWPTCPLWGHSEGGWAELGVGEGNWVSTECGQGAGRKWDQTWGCGHSLQAREAQASPGAPEWLSGLSVPFLVLSLLPASLARSVYSSLPFVRPSRLLPSPHPRPCCSRVLSHGALPCPLPPFPF